MHQMASFLYMIMEEENRQDELMHKVRECYSHVKDLRTRYGGKTVPLEKFAIEKSRRFIEDNEEPVLPAFELFYIWNIYGNSAGKEEILNPLLERLKDKMNDMKREDSYYVCLLQKGVCLRLMGKMDRASDCFNEIIDNQDAIRKDNYIPPHAAFELGKIYFIYLFY